MTGETFTAGVMKVEGSVLSILKSDGSTWDYNAEKYDNRYVFAELRRRQKEGWSPIAFASFRRDPRRLVLISIGL